MDADQIRRLEPMLDEYLSRFSDCFARRDTRAHFPVYVRGQLSDLARKSVEPMALAADVPVRTLQEFLTHLTWNLDGMRERVVQIVREEHADPEAIGIIDETGWVKKGDKTPGVQRQYCGAVGKTENCLITVHLGYAAGDFHCLLDSDMYLPRSWDKDRERCREAGIPDEVVYRPKSHIALELYDRARLSGAEFEWLTFDEFYASDGPFRRALNARDQKFVGEIRKNVRVWIEPPAVTDRPFRRHGRGRSRRTPRIVAGSPQPQPVEDVSQRHPVFRNQRWRAYRIKDTQKGPLVWRVKHALVYLKDEEGLPEGTYHLLVCRSVATGEIKYFLSNAPPRTPVRKLLRVAFERWRVERSFEDGKGELGLDHWEGRKWIGLQRHLVLTAVSHLFLAKSCLELRGEKPGGDCVPGPHGHERDRAVLVA
jgi:SRSO17 transposase